MLLSNSGKKGILKPRGFFLVVMRYGSGQIFKFSLHTAQSTCHLWKNSWSFFSFLIYKSSGLNSQMKTICLKLLFAISPPLGLLNTKNRQVGNYPAQFFTDGPACRDPDVFYTAPVTEHQGNWYQSSLSLHRYSRTMSAVWIYLTLPLEMDGQWIKSQNKVSLERQRFLFFSLQQTFLITHFMWFLAECTQVNLKHLWTLTTFLTNTVKFVKKPKRGKFHMIFSRSLAESQVQHHDAHSSSDKGIKHQGFKTVLWLSSTVQFSHFYKINSKI